MIRKLSLIFLILAAFSLTAFAQTEEKSGIQEKPKAYLFDEFGKISKKEIRLRGEKLREKMLERDSKDSGLVAYLIFYADEKGTTSEHNQDLLVDVLLSNCRDCYGYGNSPFVFVEGGKSKEQKIQFWLVPRGAEPPIP